MELIFKQFLNTLNLLHEYEEVENGGRIFSPKLIHADQNVERFYMGSYDIVEAEDMKDISMVLSSDYSF